MADLGTLPTHDLHADAHGEDLAYRDRSGAVHDWHPLIIANIAGTPNYPGTAAHYPVRLNGRECQMNSGASPSGSWPFTVAAQPWADTFGRIVYHPCHIPLLWSVSAGARTVSVKLKHTVVTGALPRVTLHSDQLMLVSSETQIAGAAINTEHELLFSIAPIIGGSLLLSLSNLSHETGETVTWGPILTT